jgi:hypothetical protein
MATMFTEADVKNIFNLFPPQKTPDFLPSLTLASSGNGFVTLQFVQAQFRSRVTKGKQQLRTHRKHLLICDQTHNGYLHLLWRMNSMWMNSWCYSSFETI